MVLKTIDSPGQASLKVGYGILLAALLVRGAVCFSSLDHYSQDADAYLAIAKTLAQTGVFGITSGDGSPNPTAYRPPLYPYLLSWMVGLGKYLPHGIAALHTLLGTVTVLCTYRSSRRLLGEVRRHRGSILAAGLVLVDPVLLQQSRETMTETLATALAGLVIWWWVRHSERSSQFETAFVLGGLLAMAYLCRPTFLVWGALLCVSTAIAQPYLRANMLVRLGRAAVVGAVLLSAVGFWAYRNSRVIGHPVWATSHGGYTLLLGNNPMFYDYLKNGKSGSIWDTDSFFLAYSHRYDGDPTTETFWQTKWQTPGEIPAEITESQDDRVSYEAARATMRRDPGTFFWSCLVRVGRLWSPLPHRTEGRSWWITIPIATFYLALFVAAAIGTWKLGRDVFATKWWPILTLFLTLSAVHAFYWSNIRMRAPATIGFAILAAAVIRLPEAELEQ
ncbi:MAG: ArnT family glycosyltransferase [Rubripirellula sp.]